MKRSFTYRPDWVLLLFGLMFAIPAGCGQIPAQRKAAVQKSMTAPARAACCSATGHIDSNVPFVLGGHCFCTPSRSLVEAMHAAGLHPDVDYLRLVQMYEDAGITTDLDHRGCNNMCSKGPHVAFGGSCMATPTPGTPNYERVIAMIVEKPDSSATQ